MVIWRAHRRVSRPKTLDGIKTLHFYHRNGIQMVSRARRGRDDLFYEWWPRPARPRPSLTTLYYVKLGRLALTQRKNEYPPRFAALCGKLNLVFMLLQLYVTTQMLSCFVTFILAIFCISLPLQLWEKRINKHFMFLLTFLQESHFFYVGRAILFLFSQTRTPEGRKWIIKR